MEVEYKVILSSDESIKTCGKCLKIIEIQNTEENIRA